MVTTDTHGSDRCCGAAERRSCGVQACAALLAELWAPVHEAVAKGEVEGLEPLLRRWSDVSESFKQRAPRGIAPVPVLDAFLASDVLADGIVASDSEVLRFKELEKEASAARSAAEAKLVTALREHMVQTGEAEAAAREREAALRERAEGAESKATSAEQAAITQQGDAQRELTELRMQLELSSSKGEEATAEVASVKEELEDHRQKLAAAQEQEAASLKQAEVSALELVRTHSFT